MVLVVAVLAAVVYAAAAVLQQRGAQSSSRLVGAHRHKGLRLVQLMLGSPLWLAGTALVGVGFSLHAIALHLGSLAIVQPIQTLTMPATLVLGASRRMPVTRSDWLGIAALCVGVAGFLAVSAPHDGPIRSEWLLLLATLVAGVLAALLVRLGTAMSRRGRGLCLGSAAAIALALVAALTKAATDDLSAGGLAGLLGHWPVYGLVLAAAAGVGLQQFAFTSAPLATVMLPVTLLNPVVSTVVGLVGWHETLSSGAIGVSIGVLAGLVLTGYGVSRLASSPMLKPAVPRVE